jgi:hypothetical protein
MHQMNNPRRTCCIVGILAASVINARGEPLGERVTCEKYGFSMAVPRGWLAGLMNGRTPMFINFDPRKSPAQPDRLPNGGATIGVVAADDIREPGSSPKWMTSLRAWASDDVRSEGSPDATIRVYL